MILTGPMLFLLYAWPCAEDRQHAGKITPADFERLKHAVESGMEPRTPLLRRCFPSAAKALEKFSKTVGKDMWSPGAVSRLWRYHHGHEGDCTVVLATVCAPVGNDIQVIFGSRTSIALNPYKLDLQVGDEVFVHRRVAVEKAD